MPEKQDPKTIRSIARLRRLGPMLETRLEDATAALELLVSEAESGEPRIEMWEQLHAAAVRDDLLVELGSAYEQLLKGRRLKPVAADTQALILMHAADFFQGVLGDAEGAAGFLERVVAAVPEHPEAFPRLERRYTAARDDRRLAELYAMAAVSRSEPAVLLIGRSLALMEMLPADAPVRTEICERLIVAEPKNPRIRTVLEAHCRKTGRFQEAAAMLEALLARPELDPREALEVRRRLVALYLGETKNPAGAMPHAEVLLQADPASVEGRKAVDRLLTHPQVAARAAAALLEARRRLAPG
jgi:tetratricopeptide (TPR) repeat protein